MNCNSVQGDSMSPRTPGQAIALAMCAIMVVQPLFAVTMASTERDGSRASAFFVWSQTHQLTYGNTGDHIGQIAVDSQGNTHYVWVNNTGTIFYGRTDPNGTFLAIGRILGTSNRAWNANPRLSLDEGDQVHITWSNDSGTQRNRVFEYVRLTSHGSIVSSKHGLGGDDIIGYSTGFATLRFFNVSGPSPPVYGPLSLLIYDGSGTLLKNLTVGYHQRTFEQATMVRNATGDIFIVYMMNQTVMNFTKVQGQTVPINQITLLTGRVNMVSPRLSLDSDGDLQLVWIDGVKNAAYQDAGIFGMRLGTDGSKLKPAGLLVSADRDSYKPDDLALLSTKGYDDFPVMARGHYTDMGSGGSEIPQFYLFAQVRKDGTVASSKSQFMEYCSGNTPAMAQVGYGQYILTWGQRSCWSESGGGTNYKDEDLFFLRSLGYHTIDLALSKGDVTYPGRIFPDEGFKLNVTVRNLGDWQSTDFVLNITDKATGSLVKNATGNLGPAANMTFSIDLNVTKQVTYQFHVDPLLNPDANLSNNNAEVTLTPVPRPDLAISSSNITFSKIRPNKGQIIEVMAQIANLGGPGAKADVAFYDGDKGPRLGKTAVDFNTSSNTTSVFWIPKAVGNRTIVVRITNVTPAELPGHAGNNEANRTILVGSPTVPSVEIATPAAGARLEIGKYNITGRAWDPDGDVLAVFIRVDGGSWAGATVRPNTTIKGFDWFILWDFADIAEGNHTITAKVLDDIHENTTSTTIQLVKYLVTFDVTGYTPKQDPTINETEGVTFQVFVNNLHNLDLNYEWNVEGYIVNSTSLYELKTTYNDSGLYNVTVNITFGSVRWTHSWNLTVKDINRPPAIGTFSPTTDPHLHSPTNITFLVTATDPDNDTLTYLWTVNGKPVSGTNGKASVNFNKTGEYYVNVTVSDGKGGVVNHSWPVEVNLIPPPCCSPPPHYHTVLEDAVWILIVIIGVITMTCIAVIYVRLTRASKATKAQKAKDGEDKGTSELGEELGPPGRIR